MFFATRKIGFAYVAFSHFRVPSLKGPNGAARSSARGTKQGDLQAKGLRENLQRRLRSSCIRNRAGAHCAADPTNPNRLARFWFPGMTRAIPGGNCKDRVVSWIRWSWSIPFCDQAACPCVAGVSASPYLPVMTSSLFSAARYALALATMMSVSAPCPLNVRLRSISFCASIAW